MKKVKIGNDIAVTWSLFRDGEPYSLEGLDMTLYLLHAFGRNKIVPNAVRENNISWTFSGKDQVHTGKYSLEVMINEGQEGMASTDYVDFVQLTRNTPCYEGEDGENVITENIELASSIAFAPVIIKEGGSGALKVWVYNDDISELTPEQVAENVETYKAICEGEHNTVVLCMSEDGQLLEGHGTITPTLTLAMKGPDDEIYDVGIYFDNLDIISGKKELATFILLQDGSLERHFWEEPFITVDSELSEISENPVQNKAVKAYVDEKVSSIGQNENTVVFYVNSRVDTPLTEEQLAHNIKMFNRVKNSTITPIASFVIEEELEDGSIVPTNYLSIQTINNAEVGGWILLTFLNQGRWGGAIFKEDGTVEIHL